MRPTFRENKVVKTREKTPTEEIVNEFSEDEITAVNDVLKVELNFTLEQKDVQLIQSIADEKDISYEVAMHAVLRDALDLYHWQVKRTV